MRFLFHICNKFEVIYKMQSTYFIFLIQGDCPINLRKCDLKWVFTKTEFILQMIIAKTESLNLRESIAEDIQRTSHKVKKCLFNFEIC